MTTEVHYWPVPAGGYAVGIGPEVVAMWGDEEVARTAVNRINAALARERQAAEARGRAAGIEAAAQVADEMQQRYGVYEDGYVGGMPRVAAAIRALKEQL